MPDYSLVPVDHQPDFDDYSLVPVDHDPFAEDGLAQQAQFQQAQAQPQSPQPQQPATGAGQPGVNGPATGNSPSGSGSGAAGRNPNDPAAEQDRSPAPVLFPGYTDPTPMLDHQPVSSAHGGSGDIPQKIVELASGQIGSGAWDANVAKGNFAEGKDKCNLFVYDTLADARASPGLPNGHWWWKHYPPTAANWADPSFAIPGWRVLSSGESPQPGDVVGQRIQWPNGATGHVMIVGPNANFLGVGESEKIESVAAKMMGKGQPGGLLVYRRYGP